MVIKEIDLAKLTNPSKFDSNIKLQGTPKYDQKTLERQDVYVQTISINDIDSYKFNPRDQSNEAFEEIKLSITANGILNMLNVSKNPKTLRFELFNGGNSRLDALKQLYKETGDSRFEEIDCNVYPWSDDDVEKIIHHLVENEVRGRLLHVDKAKTLANLENIFKTSVLGKNKDKSLLNKDFNGKKDSAESAESFRAKNYGVTTKFIDFLQSKNYTVAEQTLSTCRFTANFLISNIDYHLAQGLGTPKVAQIRLTYNNLKRYIKDIEGFSLSEFDTLFKDAISKYNNYKKGPFDFYQLVDVIAQYLLEHQPFYDIDKEQLTKIMLTKKQQKIKTVIDEDETKIIAPIDTNKELDSKASVTAIDADIETLEELENNNVDTIDDLAQAKIKGSEGVAINDTVGVLRKQIYGLACEIVTTFQAQISIAKIDYGVGFILEQAPENKDFNTWCLFYILLDYSLASDPLSPIQNTTKIINNHNNLLDLFLAKDIAAWEDIMYKLVDRSGSITPFPAVIGSFKRSIERSQWQKLSQLEFLSYQVLNEVEKNGDNIWE